MTQQCRLDRGGEFDDAVRGRHASELVGGQYIRRGEDAKVLSRADLMLWVVEHEYMHGAIRMMVKE